MFKTPRPGWLGYAATVHSCNSAFLQQYQLAQSINCTFALTAPPESAHACHSAIVHKCTGWGMSTKVIAVTINRGGTGKTMVSRSLGTLAAEAGLAVLVLDMDTQMNSTSWRRRRPEEMKLPIIQFTTEKDLEEVIERARAAECDLVVIDTPPGRSTEAAAAVEAADLVLVPCTAEVESFEGLPRTARLARTTGKPAFVIPNFVQPTSRADEMAIRGVAEKHGLPSVPSALHRFNVHREASLLGLAAQELQPESKAAAELRGLWTWLCAELQLTTSANVHKVA